MKWPYENIDYNEFNNVIKVCEQIIISLGGKMIIERKENETWVLNKEDYITETSLKERIRKVDEVLNQKMYRIS